MPQCCLFFVPFFLRFCNLNFLATFVFGRQFSFSRYDLFMSMVNFVPAHPLVISILAESAPLWRVGLSSLFTPPNVSNISNRSKNAKHSISQGHPEHCKGPQNQSTHYLYHQCSELQNDEKDKEQNRNIQTTMIAKRNIGQGLPQGLYAV